MLQLDLMMIRMIEWLAHLSDQMRLEKDIVKIGTYVHQWCLLVVKVTPQSHFNHLICIQSIVAPFDWHSYKETCTLFNFTDDDDDDGDDDDDDDDDDGDGDGDGDDDDDDDDDDDGDGDGDGDDDDDDYDDDVDVLDACPPRLSQSTWPYRSPCATKERPGLRCQSHSREWTDWSLRGFGRRGQWPHSAEDAWDQTLKP